MDAAGGRRYFSSIDDVPDSLCVHRRNVYGTVLYVPSSVRHEDEAKQACACVSGGERDGQQAQPVEGKQSDDPSTSMGSHTRRAGTKAVLQCTVDFGTSNSAKRKRECPRVVMVSTWIDPKWGFPGGRVEREETVIEVRGVSLYSLSAFRVPGCVLELWRPAGNESRVS